MRRRVGLALISAAVAGAAPAALPKPVNWPKPLPYALSLATPSWLVTLGNVARKANLTVKNVVSISYGGGNGTIILQKQNPTSFGIAELTIAPIVAPNVMHRVSCFVTGTKTVTYRPLTLVNGQWVNGPAKTVPVENGVAFYETLIGTQFFQLAVSSPEKASGITDGWGLESCTISKD
jgi:hypothetical protein